MRKRISYVLLALAPLLAASSCPDETGDEPSTASVDRVVLVYDPTILATSDSAYLRERVLPMLREGVGALPADTWLDVYTVGNGKMTEGADLRDSLPFDPIGGPAAHRANVLRVSNAVVKHAEESWIRAHTGRERPRSCILSAIRRGHESIRNAARGVNGGERIAVVIVSDLLEACGEFGHLNFEQEIPEHLGDLADSVSLSSVASVHLIKVKHQSLEDVRTDERLNDVWRDLLIRWGVDSTKIHQNTRLPADLF